MLSHLCSLFIPPITFKTEYPSHSGAKRIKRDEKKKKTHTFLSCTSIRPVPWRWNKLAIEPDVKRTRIIYTHFILLRWFWRRCCCWWRFQFIVSSRAKNALCINKININFENNEWRRTKRLPNLEWNVRLFDLWVCTVWVRACVRQTNFFILTKTSTDPFHTYTAGQILIIAILENS